MPRTRALWLLLPIAILAVPPSCQELPDAIPCGEIPANGCPVGRGGTCDDPTCAALFDCVDGKWTTVKQCPLPDGGPDMSDGGDAGQGGGGVCTPTGIDTSHQGIDCMPDLEEPDCPVEAAEPCQETACLTGCVDFFLCQKLDGGVAWIDVAYCDDSGQLVVQQ